MDIPQTTILELISRYDVILLDAYGVLLQKEGVFPGAQKLLEHLQSQGKPYFVVTNDASKHLETTLQSYLAKGLNLQAKNLITSASLILGHFQQKNLKGARCLVLGPRDVARHVEEAGGVLVSIEEDAQIDALVICDEDGYPFVETVDTTLTILFRMFDQGRDVSLILPNPDLIYPKSKTSFGITSGSIALILEAALQVRYPNHTQRNFVRLGKPHPAIFQEAYRRCGNKNMVMIGDQVTTDIHGANNFGIDSALIATGVSSLLQLSSEPSLRPTYFLESLLF